MSNKLQSTYHRGKPDKSDYRSIPVHYMPDLINPLCNNGAYHIRYTGNTKKVTCTICKQRLGIK